MENIKKKLKENEFKNVVGLKSHVKRIYDDILISVFLNRIDSVRDSYKRVLAIYGKHFNY